MIKKLQILGLAALALLGTTMTACGEKDVEEPHSHTFEEHWYTDEQYHWHAASCEHEDEIADKAAHVDEDGNEVCDVCGYRQKHVHTYEQGWTQGEKTHYHKNTCGHDDVEKYRADEALHVDENNDGICDVCSYTGGHTHTYADVWTATENGHWHAPTCGHDVPGIDLQGHNDADNDGACDDCGDTGGHTHTWATEWTTDNDYHWHAVTCGHDIPVKDKNIHVDANGDATCDTCSAKPGHFHTVETDWSADAAGHFHKATCHEGIRADEALHEGYGEDGVCDICQYIVFHLYEVKVILPEDTVKIKAPDGSDSTTFTVKEGTDATFVLTVPTYIRISEIKGASIEGAPVKDGRVLVYTVKITAITGPLEITMTLIKNSNVDVIIPDGKLDVVVETAPGYVTGQVTVHVPSSGRYVIYSISHSDIKFSLKDNEVEQYQNGISYEFDALAEGDVTLDYRYFAWDAPEGESNTITITYVVARVDPTKTLESLKGEGYLMPTNANVELTFTVPEPGLYQISSSYVIAWNDDVTSPHIFAVEAGALTQTITMHYKLESEASFDFDWEIKQVGGANKVELGENDVKAPMDDYYGILFTAPKDGAYHFACSDPNVYLYKWTVTEYGSSMNPLGSGWSSDEMKAGDTLTLYVRVNIYDSDIQDDIASVLTIGYIPTKTDNSYLAVTGVENIFVASETDDQEFAVTLSDGGQISLDGGKTWQSSVEALTVPAGTVITYLVKADGAETVTVTFSEVVYRLNLQVGSNTVTMKPGKEYLVTLSGTASPNRYVEYTLQWTDAHISVSYGGYNITAGSTITRYDSTSSILVFVYNGSSEATLTIEIGDPYHVYAVDALKLIGVYHVDTQFMKGIYVLTFSPINATSGTLTIRDKNANKTTSYRYTYNAATGAVTVTTPSGGASDVQITGDADGNLLFQCDGVTSAQTLISQNGELCTGETKLGTNTLYVLDGKNGSVFIFNAPEAGTYTFSYPSSEKNGYAMTDQGTPVEFPRTVTLAANQIYTFVMATQNERPDLVEIVIAKTA